MNQHYNAVQNESRVAMGPDGTFVIAWASNPLSLSNTTATNSVIYAREYGPNGQAIASEFQVSSTSVYAQSLPDVAMDANDDFVIVWEGDTQSPIRGVYGEYFTAVPTSTTLPPTVWSAGGLGQLAGLPAANSNSFSGTVIGLQENGPRVGMDAAGGFVVTWDANTGSATQYDIYAQRFQPGGAAAGPAFMVNITTAGFQVMPGVGVNAAGDFTIVWTSWGQDNAQIGNPGINDYGVYCRMFNADGSNYSYVDPTSGVTVTPLEFRVNATTLGDQVAPAVSRQDPMDDSIIAWVGPTAGANGTTAIFLRNIDPPAQIVVPPTPAISVSNAALAAGAVATEATFTVTLSTPTTKPVSVNYTTADGSLKSVFNYAPISGTLAFSPGQKSKTITVERGRHGACRAAQPDVQPRSVQPRERHVVAGLGHGNGRRRAAHSVAGDLRFRHHGPGSARRPARPFSP